MNLRAAFLIVLLSPAAALAVPVEKLVRVHGGKTVTSEVVKGEIFVKAAPGFSEAALRGMLAARGFKPAGRPARHGYLLVRLPEGMSVASALSALSSAPGVEAAEPNNAYRVRRTANDPLLGAQYYLSQMSAFAAWEYETGASNPVTIAIVDTGIYGGAGSTELAPKLIGTSQFFNPNTGLQSADQPPTPACNHATGVAGVAAAEVNNSTGIAGLSWGARLISLKVFDDNDCNMDCSDRAALIWCTTDDDAIADAIEYARTVLAAAPATYGKVIVNMSLGGTGACTGALQGPIDAASDAGVMLIAAAGNDSYEVGNPANCRNVLPVSATDDRDNLASFSSRDVAGNSMRTRGVAAPGMGILTTDVGGVQTTQGTSFSSPLVAGAAALVWSANPLYKSTDVANALRNSADDLGPQGPDGQFGFGRVNVFKALKLAADGTLAGYKGLSKVIGFPNPFRPARDRMMTISLPSSSAGSDLTIEIFNSEGERVRKLHAPSWDGRNEGGNLVASGVYQILVVTDNGKARGRVAVIR